MHRSLWAEAAGAAAGLGVVVALIAMPDVDAASSTPEAQVTTAPTTTLQPSSASTGSGLRADEINSFVARCVGYMEIGRKINDPDTMLFLQTYGSSAAEIEAQCRHIAADDIDAYNLLEPKITQMEEFFANADG